MFHEGLKPSNLKKFRNGKVKNIKTTNQSEMPSSCQRPCGL